MKYIVGILFAVILGVAAVGITQNVSAADKNDFNPGNIIDDAVFYNANALNTSQIQTFLESKNPSCDYWGTQSAADWGYPHLTHAQIAEYKRNGSNGFARDSTFHAPPYKCLTMYSQDTPQMEASSGYCSAIPAGTRTAAQIINDVSKACGINPQVLIILLEKEQSLVTDKWPLDRQLRNATGFACPDTAPCDPSYAGFFYQVYHAARQFKVYQAFPNSYNYRAGRNNNIYWNPDLSRCGSSTVYIQNQATAALYIYTPYRPNQAALDNLYGSGDSCSAYGNRNFWRIFTDWFGSTKGFEIVPELSTRYSQTGGSSGIMGKITDSGYCNTGRTICWQSFTNGALIWSQSTGAWESKGGIRDRWAQLGYQSGSLGFPVSQEYWDGKGWWQSYQNGAIIGTEKTGFWESTGTIRDRWGAIGYQNSFMGYPKGPVVRANNNTEAWQEYEKGYIFWSSTSGAWESTGGIRARWAQLGYQSGSLGFPTGPEARDTKGAWYQSYQNGVIIGAGNNGFWESTGPIRARWIATGSENSFMGYPKGQITYSADRKTAWQEYEKGFLYWQDGVGAWESTGGIRQYWAQLGYGSGPAGAPAGPEQYNAATKTWSQRYQHGTIYITEGSSPRFEP